MSHVQCFARTNYFAVRNLQALLSILEPYDVEVDQVDKDGVTYVAITGNDGDTGQFPGHMKVSEEMLEFSEQLAEIYRSQSIDVNEMDSGELADSVRKMCDLHGKHAADHDIWSLVELLRAEYPEDIEIDFGKEIAPFVADGAVLVMNEVGMEGRKLPHSVFGISRALINTGEEVSIDLYDIEKLAEAKFGIKPSRPGEIP